MGFASIQELMKTAMMSHARVTGSDMEERPPNVRAQLVHRIEARLRNGEVI